MRWSSCRSSSIATRRTRGSSRSPWSSTGGRSAAARRLSAIEAAIDVVVDKLERRAVDHRAKPRVRARPVEEKQLLRQLADGTAEAGRPRRVVKTKRFGIEPMFEEDAIAEMDELGHSFFLFVNAETERLAVIYRRDDGDFGLIEPVVGGAYAPSGPAGSRPATGHRGSRAG